MKSNDWLKCEDVLDILSKMGLLNVRKYENKRSDLVKLIIRYLIVDTNTAAITEFRRTLQGIQVWDHIKHNMHVWKHIFCDKPQLRSKDITNMFDFQISSDGSNNWNKEKNTVFYLNKFVRNCES